MSSSPLLEMTDIRSWRRRFSRVNGILKRSCGGYVLVVVVMFLVLIITSLWIKDDISLSIEHFSINAVSGEEASPYPLSFEGIVPLELKEIYPPESIRIIKIYVAPSEVGRVHWRKINVPIDRVKIHWASESVEFQSQDAVVRGTRSLIPMRIGMLKARLSRTSVDGIDTVALVNELHGTGIGKAKIVLGETSLLELWLKKIFSKSPLFTKMSQFMD